MLDLCMEIVREEVYPKAIPVPEVTITSLLRKVLVYNPEVDEELSPGLQDCPRRPQGTSSQERRALRLPSARDRGYPRRELISL
jgi:hypothetical protein